MTQIKRVHERYNHVMTVTVVYGGAGDVPAAELEAQTENLSLGGMFIATADAPIPFGSAVKVRFRVPALKDELVEAEATVRWKTPAGVGVQFGSLRANAVWGLNQLIKTLTPA